MADEKSEAAPLPGDFCLEIDFERGSGDPKRVFRAMGELIEAYQELDVHLAHSIDVRLEPALVLQEVEAGSLRSWLLIRA